MNWIRKALVAGTIALTMTVPYLLLLAFEQHYLLGQAQA